MGKLEIGTEFRIAAFIAMLCAMLLLVIIYQEETIDNACAAIEIHDQSTAKVYIDKVWNINRVGKRKETALMVACESGNGEMIKYLIDRGADVNKTMPGHLTALELFCKNGYEAGTDALLALLSAGVNQSEYTEKPAIVCLAENYYWMNDEQKKTATKETILLLQHGAPLAYEETSLLHFAAKSNMADLFYTIVHTKEGLQMLTMKDGDGNSPWDVAVQSGSVAVQKVIRNLELEYEEVKKEEAEKEENNEQESVEIQPTETIDPAYRDEDDWYYETHPTGGVS